MNMKSKMHENIFRKKLTVNIATFMVVVMVAIYSVIALLVSYLTGTALDQMKANNFQALSNSAVYQIKDYINKFETSSGVIAQNPTLIHAVAQATKENPVSQHEDFSDLIQILRTFSDNNKEVLNIGFGVMQEDTLYTQEGESLGSGFSLRESQIYEAIEKNELVVTEPYLDTITGELCVSIVEPIRSGNTPVGLLFIDLNLNYFSELLDILSVGKTGSAALYAEDGTIIASANKAAIGQKVSKETGFTGEDFYEELKQPSGRLIEFYYNDEAKKATLIEVPGYGWRFISGMSKAEYSKEINFLTSFLFVAILLATLLIDILAVRYIKKKLSPIQKINSYILRLADGYIDFDVVQTQENELGEIEDALKRCTENISTYITEIDHVMSDLSKGDFTSEINCEFQGDFRSIQESINRFKALFSQTINHVVVAANQISEGADQVSHGAQALAQGATEQASSIEELSAAIAEISDNVNSNASNSQKANELATESGTVAAETLKDMNAMLLAMKQISVSAEDIGKVIKVIDDITFQTNILSLNAAVEAARAGVSGKGFAVVADEVRNLAQKSSESAKEIATLIDGTITSVKQGEKIAEKTGAAFYGLTDKIQEVVTTVEDIAKASSEQAASIEQITEGIDQISSVVQTNSATSEESAAASEELSSQSGMLTSMVNRFKLHSEG